MGVSTLSPAFTINGVISTEKTCMQNLETLAAAARTWITYDVHTGQWAVIINRAGNSVASFSNSNILGPISVTGTALQDLYNGVRVEFPHKDLNDRTDFVEIEIPAEDRNNDEPDNVLNMAFDCINDPVQAEYLGMVELKQARLDKIVSFTTDWSQFGLSAGDIIDITNDVYGWTNKEFRIITIAERDTDDGGINLEITALEYDDNIYSTDDLFRYTRTLDNRIDAIGNIGTPITPTVTVYNFGSDPRAEIEAIVPSGLVTTMDLYVSQDSVNFTFVESAYGNNGNAFNSGDSVVYSYREIPVGTVYAKVQATNERARSEFSGVGSDVTSFSFPGAPGASKFQSDIEWTVSAPSVTFSNPIFDYFTYTGNAVSQAAINQSESGMSILLFDEAQANAIANTLPLSSFVPHNDLVLKVDAVAMVLNTKSIFGHRTGLSLWWSLALYDPVLFEASLAAGGTGYGGLTWSDWYWLGQWCDGSNLISGPVQISTPGLMATPFSLLTPQEYPYIISVGVSSTAVPNWPDLQGYVNPVSGIPGLGTSIGYAGNTVVENTTGNVTIYEAPGTANATSHSWGYGATDVFLAKKYDY